MNPKYVMVVRRDPGKRYFLLSILLTDEPGALTHVSRALAIRGLNILESYSCSTEKENQAVWSLIAETYDKRMDADFLIQLLKESNFVEKVEVKESKNGLIIDSLNFPILIGSGSRAIVIHADYMARALAAISERFGEEGSRMIFEMGMSCGMDRIGFLFKDSQEEPRAVIDQSLELLSATGWGRGSIVHYNPSGPALSIAVQSNFECTGVSSQKPTSNFLRGVFQGAVGAILGEGFECRETQCVAKGDKQCLFEISRLAQPQHAA